MSSKADSNQRIPSSGDETTMVGQLQKENADLQHAVELRTQENVLLNEVLSTVGSTLRLDDVLHHLVDIVVRATQCQMAFIYMYNKEKERLVLASTTQHHKHLVGKIDMGLGEGIAGWVALHRTPVFLKDEAMDDPRFYYFPELEEEKFQSILTVPIITKDRNLLGVITLQAVAPHEFTEEHHKFVSNIAALVASAIENAQLYENTQRKLSILTSLSVLSQTISSGLYLDDMLRSLATLTVQIMEIDLCVVMLMDQSRERDTDSARHIRRLVVRATSPNLHDRVSFQSIDVDRNVMEQLNGLHEIALRTERGERGERGQNGNHMSASEYTLSRLNPIQDTPYKTLISAPLIAGTEHLGLINCYSSKPRRYSVEDQTLLTTIANQAAIAIKNSHLVNQLAQKNLVKGFFDDLLHGTPDTEDSLKQRASFLGCDLTRSHAVVIIETTHVEVRKGESKATSLPESKESKRSQEATTEEGQAQSVQIQAMYKRIAGVFRRRIQDSYPGSLLYEHENLLTCIISLSKDPTGMRLKTWLFELARQMHNEYGVQLSVGIGNTCQSISDYRRGFAEANEAIQMGQNLQKEGEADAQPLVTHFNDLGVYRYLYKIARMDDLRDVYQDQIALINSYDARKNTDLLDTLEVYLECAGNLTKTSERLFVHRNTLIQRLDRLQSLCEVDLQERANWLTLQIAIKVYKLRSGSI